MKRVLILLSFVMMVILGGCGENESPQELVIKNYLIEDGVENIDCWMKEIKEKFSNDEITKLVDIISKIEGNPSAGLEIFNEGEIVLKIMTIDSICKNK